MIKKAHASFSVKVNEKVFTIDYDDILFFETSSNVNKISLHTGPVQKSTNGIFGENERGGKRGGRAVLSLPSVISSEQRQYQGNRFSKPGDLHGQWGPMPAFIPHDERVKTIIKTR